MTEEFEELPDDNFRAFLKLESEFRTEYTEKTEGESNSWNFNAADYMNKVLAAATALDIEALSGYHVPPHNHDNFHEGFWAFFREVDSVLIQIRIHNSRQSKTDSVGFSEEQRTKIHALIEKIRGAVEGSTATVPKKERLFNILAILAKEVSKPRTPLARFGDLARGLAGISKDVAEEGAEPWWKWAKLIYGEVDDAKEAEPALPKPKEIKQIESPRKELPKPYDEPGDEIPF